VVDYRIGCASAETEETRVGAGAEGDDLFGLVLVLFEKAEDEFVNGSGSDVRAAVDDGISFRDWRVWWEEGFRVGVFEISHRDGAHPTAAGIMIGLLHDGISAGFYVLFVVGELFVVAGIW
jgi:hypothetical protein